ncbi:MAG TPA: ABC transporter substrate-binding protein, partial [Polyangia bacterium]|nr:ABC transporter substrate-binding protein [Polyangia bacterium]
MVLPDMSAWRTGLTMLAVVVVGLALGLTACDNHQRGNSAGGGLAGVRASGVLRWGGDQQGGEPFVFQDPARPAALTGFEVEIADAIAAQLGVRAHFVQNDWSNLVPSLERKTFDMAMNGLEVTPARAGRVLFSRPYYLFAERLVARANDATVVDLASLRGRRVGTLANSQAWDMLLASGSIAVPYEGVEEPFIDLEHGRTDAVLLDDIIVDRYAGRHPGLRVVGDIADGRYAIAFRRDDAPLRDAVDTALALLVTTGQLQRIFQRYHLDNPRQAALAVAGPTTSLTEAGATAAGATG